MNATKWTRLAAAALLISAAGLQVEAVSGQENDAQQAHRGRKAKNVILFIGDGMGVSTISATRVFSVGVAGELVVDKFPYTALSRTYSEDSITPDSAPTMSAMMTGINTNQSVIGFGENTEPNDFNSDGDGPATWTMLEIAKKNGMKVGVVSTARITHATGAATYAHINQRNNENQIALQSLPTDATYNTRLGRGIDVIMGGGRRYFVPSGMPDEEGENGSRSDGRDLRTEFQSAGYKYVWNKTGFNSLTKSNLPVLGLFERDHMEYEYDRPTDQGQEPSIAEMTAKSIELLQGSKGNDGYFLMVEGGRIDHAHHEGNAYRAITDTVALDEAIMAALQKVDLRDTLILVSADHSHVFNIAGYPMRPLQELPYAPTGYSPDYPNAASHGNGILDVVFDLDQSTGYVTESTDSKVGAPYTVLGYHNGRGYRNGPRFDPRLDPFLGRDGAPTTGPWDVDYFQESAVPLGSETHAGEDVAIYGVGAGSELVRGTVKNTHIFTVMKEALGF